MNIKSDHRSVILFWLILVMIASSIIISFNKYLMRKDFNVRAKVACDSNQVSCFEEECDTSDPRCPSSGIFYFKIVEKKSAVEIPLEECGYQKQCQVIYCDPENASEYSSTGKCSKTQ